MNGMTGKNGTSGRTGITGMITMNGMNKMIDKSITRSCGMRNLESYHPTLFIRLVCVLYVNALGGMRGMKSIVS